MLHVMSVFELNKNENTCRQLVRRFSFRFAVDFATNDITTESADCSCCRRYQLIKVPSLCYWNSIVKCNGFAFQLHSLPIWHFAFATTATIHDLPLALWSADEERRIREMLINHERAMCTGINIQMTMSFVFQQQIFTLTVTWRQRHIL